ncbi:bifunctional (p)ppGpp synthetase/guanosine-3',5'-bis(diphosphate) 3'-pyrophosphohydrolase [Chitinibacter bivalviorum]|uniref:GTP pyrophosphokinase n=1 Tax=Chitinibacter bivalviorum TaxID=2739434 RepID=A0A7H9BIM6_9NEIS|nr:bifunctional (p)ppGpp synthetase/guanosine-3',5'-bis(diphosphate) 3'-pyrophosphohydrolase [Chitinibacter bivalviorum]QLG88078.1 bifunctional (p)ppGpp synthetase/guanosine-3',5'-bis(diphosphate) 3'-pyrophosphohydrolase [Chitinibacter bivalviorum]
MVAVTRPLAQSIAEAADPDRWLSALAERYPPNEIARLREALDWIGEVYGKALNPDTDESLFLHAVASASIVADLRMDANAVIAAILFCVPDFIEKSGEQIDKRFGKVVAQLVDGISKVRKLRALAKPATSKAEDYAQQIEAQRKMLLAMVEDIRAVLIKLAWRTQTMHSIAKISEERRRKIAQETLDVFAPLANRLGVWQIKWELEDLGFRFLHTDTYKKIAKLLLERRVDREHFIAEVLGTLRAELGKAGVTHVDLMGRPKHIYSIWKKMQKKKLDFSELYDIRAVRVLVDDVKDCYTVLGIVHNLWQPIPGEFDDYIAQPKGNFYRSLHTAVIGPQDKAVEVQIRTFDMHDHAEYGVAAHWRYKEGGHGDARYEEKIAWLRQLLDWREDVATDDKFTDAFKAELFEDTIYVLTPAGRVISLPKGSTPVDFAYHLHTDLGHRCRGAKINGQIVPLNTALENGQRVEILSTKEGGPSLDWLHQGYVKSHRAAQKIRYWIRQQNLDVAIEAGKNLYEKEAARAGAGQLNQELIANRLGFKTIDEVHIALGQGEVSLRELNLAFNDAQRPVEPVAAETPEDFVRAARASQYGEGILIEGIDKLMTMLAKCCKPVPPDAVMGYVTKGRGISIHRCDCTALKRLAQEAPERLIRADWGNLASSAHVFAVDILVEANERASLLRDLTDVMSREKINVTAANMQIRDGRARVSFTIEIRDSEQLQRIFTRLQDVGGVIRCSRT